MHAPEVALPHGMVAEFDTPDALLRAANAAREAARYGVGDELELFHRAHDLVARRGTNR